MSGFVSDQFAIPVNKPPYGNRANIILLGKRTLPFLPGENLPPRDLIFFEKVEQFHYSQKVQGLLAFMENDVKEKC